MVDGPIYFVSSVYLPLARQAGNMKVLSIVKYIFTVAGLGMLIGAFYSFNNTREFLSDALTTQGKVVELVRSRSSDSITYRPVVEFTTQDGLTIEFASSSGSNPPSYTRGEAVDVVYQESSPERAEINSFFSLWGAATVLGLLGSVFFIIGFSIIVLARRKRRKIQVLKKNGVPIKAEVTGVAINTSVQANGRSPYQIVSQWQNPATSKIHVFSSENIWFDPSDYILGEQITVLIERNNPEKYYVDISFLPELSG